MSLKSLSILWKCACIDPTHFISHLFLTEKQNLILFTCLKIDLICCQTESMLVPYKTGCGITASHYRHIDSSVLICVISFYNEYF